MTKLSEMPPEQFEAAIRAKRAARMQQIDDLPADTRHLVHEYGLNVVRTLLDLGIKQPRQIKHVVETILDEFSPTRGSCSSQGIKSEVER